MYGMEVRKSFEDAYSLDRINGNIYWSKSIYKKMNNVMIVFSIIQEGETLPANLKRIFVHMIFQYKDGSYTQLRIVGR